MLATSCVRVCVRGREREKEKEREREGGGRETKGRDMGGRAQQ